MAPPIAQDPWEFEQFLNIVAMESNIASYLEIGVRHGGSFNGVARVISPNARIVGVDLPGGPWGVPAEATVGSVNQVIAAALDRGQQAKMIYGNSRDEAVIAQVRERGPFDLLFIDGDHSLAGVTADWETYGPMARIVAFHDIDSARSHKASARNVGVRPLWDGLKEKHRHIEIVGLPGGWGIGMLWNNV